MTLEGTSQVTPLVQLWSIVAWYCSSMALAPRARRITSAENVAIISRSLITGTEGNHARNREAGKAVVKAQAKPMVRPTTLVTGRYVHASKHHRLLATLGCQL